MIPVLGATKGFDVAFQIRPLNKGIPPPSFAQPIWGQPLVIPHHEHSPLSVVKTDSLGLPPTGALREPISRRNCFLTQWSAAGLLLTFHFVYNLARLLFVEIRIVRPSITGGQMLDSSGGQANDSYLHKEQKRELHAK